jgi:bifunctional DNase/RNase
MERHAQQSALATTQHSAGDVEERCRLQNAVLHQPNSSAELDDEDAAIVEGLGEKNGTREFPIFIGYAEALALDLALHGYKNIRPMTHDLIYNLVDGLGAEMSHVVVDDLRQDTFFGKLVVKTAQGTQEVIDSRPSDAIVLATKRQLPIFVAEHVLDQVLRHQEEEEEE